MHSQRHSASEATETPDRFWATVAVAVEPKKPVHYSRLMYAYAVLHGLHEESRDERAGGKSESESSLPLCHVRAT